MKKADIKKDIFDRYVFNYKQYKFWRHKFCEVDNTKVDAIRYCRYKNESFAIYMELENILRDCFGYYDCHDDLMDIILE